MKPDKTSLWRRIALAVCAVLALLMLANDIQGKTMYVGVDSTSPDAALQSSKSTLNSKTLAKLSRDQEVEVLDEAELNSSKPFVKVRIKDGDKTVEGYVKRAILVAAPVSADAKAGEARGTDIANKATKGLNKEIEGDMRKNSEQMSKALDQVDQFEATRNKELGGDSQKPDTDKVLGQYRDFGKNGKLLD